MYTNSFFIHLNHMADDSSEETKKKKLKERQMDLHTGLSLYPNIIDRLKYQSTPEQINKLKDHYLNLKSEHSHIDFKKDSMKCLGCDKLLTCPRKCEEKFK